MTQDPLVTADWLLANLSTPDLRILDATWVPPFLTDRPDGMTSYQAGHIPGSLYFDIDEIADQNTSLNHMLPAPALFEQKVGHLGINNDSTVVVYDDNSFYASARAWWMFRTMGHDKVRVLDGGLTAWCAIGGEIQTHSNDQDPAPFTARFNPELVRAEPSMRAHIEARDTRILDARDRGRFNGTSPEPRAGLPSGHMPGSVCIPASTLLTPDKTMKSKADLMPPLDTYTDAPVVTSCGSGVSAAVIALALARLGNWDAAIYDGSWSEWASNSDNPIATTP